MNARPTDPAIGLLLSGGLDSSILLGWLLGQDRDVRPIYIRSDLVWGREELQDRVG